MTSARSDSADYRLDDQVGYVLRRVTQRHLAIFAAAIPEVTTTQFAVLARLTETGPLSQNQLGRATAMDAATIKGVVDRLARLGLLATSADPADRRRLTATALQVSQDTLSPLDPKERDMLIALLLRLT